MTFPGMQTGAVSTVRRRWRTPRRVRGSGTGTGTGTAANAANAANRSTCTASRPAPTHPGRAARTQIGEDEQAGMAVAPVIGLA